MPIKGNANSKKRGIWISKETLIMVKQRHKMWYKIRSDTDKAKYRRQCMNLLETLDFITYSLVEGNNVNEILLDFAKAFDLVPHRRLVHKIKGYGVSNDMSKCFEHFLNCRKQRVTIGETSYK